MNRALNKLTCLTRANLRNITTGQIKKNSEKEAVLEKMKMLRAKFNPDSDVPVHLRRPIDKMLYQVTALFLGVTMIYGGMELYRLVESK